MEIACETKSSILKNSSLILTLFFLVCFNLLSNSAFAQDNEDKPVVVNDVSPKVPLKVEIIMPDKEEDFPEKIQVKITNTGEKPIYSLRMFLDTVDSRAKRERVAPNGKPFYDGYDLNYGRRELWGIGIAKESPNETDIPIKTNESYTFKVNKKYAETVKKSLMYKGDPSPKVYRLLFFDLNYGDGTGFTRAGAYSKKN